MSIKVKVMGEGGVHRHALAKPERTQKDGIHKHLFFVMDRLLMTDLSGEHEHPINPRTGAISPSNEPHKHKIQINTPSGLQEIEVDAADDHGHELQVGGTTLSGLHIHRVRLGDNEYVSILPQDLIEAVESATKSVPALKDFKIKRDDETPMEMNFQTVKRLNADDFKAIMKSAVPIAIFKSLTRMGEGMKIESMILSRERYADIGLARRYVMDHGLEVVSSEEREQSFVFQVMDKSRFDEGTLQRVRITDGVEAVVGFLKEEDISNQQTAQQAAVTEGSGADMLTENAVAPPTKPDAVTSPTLAPMMDKTSAERTPVMGLKEKLAKARSHFDFPVSVTKRASKKALTNWKTDQAVTGTTLSTLLEIAKKHGISRKFVSVEYPQKRYLEYLTEKFEVVQAAYENAVDKDKEEQEYVSLYVKGDHLDAVLYQEGWKKSLVIFFDDESKLDEIFKNELLNYEMGAYSYKHTMMGPCLVPVEIAFEIPPIIDEEILTSLKQDTDLFFSAATEKFFKDNEAGVQLVYKRGIILYGPPGNGKTTFIKSFAQEFQKDGYVVLCEPQDFDGGIGKFLKSCFGAEAKKTIVFEDVDCIHWENRSALLNFLDGVNVVNKTLFIATTNYPGRLDEALVKRPSRFDQKYKIDLPSFAMRKKFLNFFFKNLTTVELDRYAVKTEGFSGAYFKELFILKGMRNCTIDKAISIILSQMCDITKKVDPNKVTQDEQFAVFKEIVFTKTSLSGRLAKSKAMYAEGTVEEDGGVKKTVYFEILKRDDEKRLMVGPVLIPENVDLQDDIISVDEIEKAAHNYMIKLCFNEDPEFLAGLGLNKKSKRGFMHVEFNRKLAVVESYCAPVDFELNGRKVVQGTWVMSMKVFDDEVWNLVKAKKINGFSIGGRSKMRPEERTV